MKLVTVFALAAVSLSVSSLHAARPCKLQALTSPSSFAQQAALQLRDSRCEDSSQMASSAPSGRDAGFAASGSFAQMAAAQLPKAGKEADAAPLPGATGGRNGAFSVSASFAQMAAEQLPGSDDSGAPGFSVRRASSRLSRR